MYYDHNIKEYTKLTIIILQLYNHPSPMQAPPPRNPPPAQKSQKLMLHKLFLGFLGGWRVSG